MRQSRVTIKWFFFLPISPANENNFLLLLIRKCRPILIRPPLLRLMLMLMSASCSGARGCFLCFLFFVSFFRLQQSLPALGRNAAIMLEETRWVKNAPGLELCQTDVLCVVLFKKIKKIQLQVNLRAELSPEQLLKLEDLGRSTVI